MGEIQTAPRYNNFTTFEAKVMGAHDADTKNITVLLPALIEDNEETMEQSEGGQVDLDDEHNQQYFTLRDQPQSFSFDLNGPNTGPAQSPHKPGCTNLSHRRG